MDTKFATALLEWHDFFTAIAGVSGTLVGLLFVALGLNPTIMADESPAGLRVWAGQTFHSFLVVLVIGLAGLVPARAGETFAITLAFVGAQGVVRVITDLRRVRPTTIPTGMPAKRSYALSRRLPPTSSVSGWPIASGRKMLMHWAG